MPTHFILPLLIAVLALLFLDPLHLLMPGMLAQLILGLLVLGTALYSVLVFRERPRDEREAHIRAVAHRASYLVGVIGLVLIIAYHLLTKGHVYPETIVLLVLLVATKAAVHWYGERHL